MHELSLLLDEGRHPSSWLARMRPFHAVHTVKLQLRGQVDALDWACTALAGKPGAPITHLQLLGPDWDTAHMSGNAVTGLPSPVLESLAGVGRLTGLRTLVLSGVKLGGSAPSSCASPLRELR